MAGLLLLWQIGEAAAAAPDYLTYFNQLAAGEPQRIVTGSDLDWGQDVKRLAAALKQRHVDRVSLAVHTSADLRQHDDLPPIRTLYPGETATGWIAISEQMSAFYCAGYRWLDAYRPVARIGASIRLYYVPGPPMPPRRPGRMEAVQLERSAALLSGASAGQSGAAPPSLTGSQLAGSSIAISGARPLRDIQRER